MKISWRVLGLPCVALACALVCIGCGPPAERSEVEFRDRVLAIAQAEFPDRHFEATSDPHILKSGVGQHGLPNLYAKFQQTDRSDRALKELVKEHFAANFAALDSAAATPKVDWATAKPLLRPQVMPREYLQRLPLVSRPLARDALEAYVLDHETSYEYVSNDDLERWHVAADEVRKLAADNLDRASKGLEVEAGSGPDKFLAVETGDSYDAARLLVPQLRQSFAGQLGDTYYAAIPNRGLLIMWSTSSSPAAQQRFQDMVAKDFRTQPYPLSRSIFKVTAAEITEIPQQTE
ncbi:MAG: DUF1444 family protein [Acidobacteriota bacterium]